MRPTTGRLACLAVMGAGFMPETADHRYWAQPAEGTAVDDLIGTYVGRFTNPDGRTFTITTRGGDGWQCGRLVSAVAAGPWDVQGALTCTTPWQVRRLLAEHEPGRERTYECGPGVPIRQARALDGRERDILCRILSDVLNACRDRERQARLLQVIHLDGDEVYRLMEMRAVLETRVD